VSKNSQRENLTIFDLQEKYKLATTAKVVLPFKLESDIPESKRDGTFCSQQKLNLLTNGV